MDPHVAILDALRNFIKALFCILNKVGFVTAVPNRKKFLHSKTDIINIQDYYNILVI